MFLSPLFTMFYNQSYAEAFCLFRTFGSSKWLDLHPGSLAIEPRVRHHEITQLDMTYRFRHKENENKILGLNPAVSFGPLTIAYGSDFLPFTFISI